MHSRIAIRQAVVDILIAAATDAGANVFKSKKRGNRESEVPLLAIYMIQEDVEAESVNTSPREYTREGLLVIEAWHKSTPDRDDVADKLDGLAHQVEQALNDNVTLSTSTPVMPDGPADELILQGTVIELQPEGRDTMGMAALTYLVTYRTDEQLGAAVVDDFDRASATYNPSGTADPGDIPVDEFEVPGP